MKTLVLFSSADHQGNTAKVLERVASLATLEIINIDKLTITPYNYPNQYPADDFYGLVERMLAADNLMFASPNYWHAPTAPMKALMDRITELTDVEKLKPKGRALAGKNGLVLTSSSGRDICPIFDQIFAMFFRYFDIHYSGKLNADCRDGIEIDQHELERFIAQLKTDNLSG